MRILALLIVMAATGILRADELTLPVDPPNWIVITVADSERVTLMLPQGTRPVVREQTYIVRVPYTETVNGVEEVKFREEERTRNVTVMQKFDTPQTIRWRVQDLVFLDVNGKVLSYEKDVVGIKTPAAALSVVEPSVHPFYSAILKPDTIIVVVPKK